MTVEYLASLDPVFAEPGRRRYDSVITAARPEVRELVHRHTIAHCPPIADGAALVLLGNSAVGERYGLEPLARVVGSAGVGGDHVDQLTAGEAAMQCLLDRVGIGVEDVDLFEYMEAFAVVPALFRRRYDIDPGVVNPSGGHLAMGHPMGATGAILLTALVHGMRRSGAQRGLAVGHGGSGVGAAALLEAV